MFTPPRNPWRSDQLSQELFLLGTYGLRNKRELWRAQTRLSNFRKQARKLLAASSDVRGREEPQLMNFLTRLGLLQGMQNSLDDVLSLTIENLLERRLQTLVWKRGLAKTPYQARQMITHGHIALNQRKVTIPSYTVSPTEEGSLSFSEGSSFFKLTQTSTPGETTEAQSMPVEAPVEGPKSE